MSTGQTLPGTDECHPLHFVISGLTFNFNLHVIYLCSITLRLKLAVVTIKLGKPVIFLCEVMGTVRASPSIVALITYYSRHYFIKDLFYSIEP